MIAWLIAFEIVDETEAAVARKVEAFVRWCGRKGTEARVARQEDTGSRPGGPIRRLVEFELRSERFRHPVFYYPWRRLFAAPLHEPKRARTPPAG
jgi:hypothetical protein